MADTFFSQDVASLLHKKRVLMFGCSNMRALYKDLVWLYNGNTLIENCHLRKKLESSFLGDRLISQGKLTKSRHFVEQRVFKKDYVHFEFHFLTRCYCPTIVDILTDIKNIKKEAPDVILISSTLWDLCRWGPNGIDEFKTNLVKLMDLFSSCLPCSTLVIWSTALPVHSTIRGGLIIKQIEFMQESLRFNLMEANLYARNTVQKYGFDILDLHYHMNLQVSRRSCDGVHYLPLPLRLMTNIFLTHLALTWGSDLPIRFGSLLLEKELLLSQTKSIEAAAEKSKAPEKRKAPEPLKVTPAKRKRASRRILTRWNTSRRYNENEPSHNLATFSCNYSHNPPNNNNYYWYNNNGMYDWNRMINNNCYINPQDEQVQRNVPYSHHYNIYWQQTQVNNFAFNVNPYAKYYN